MGDLSCMGNQVVRTPHIDGLDLMPLLTQQAKLESHPIIFHYPHYTHATGLFSTIIENNWKLIRFYNDEHGAYLLYNLAKDPEERNNQAAAHPEILQKLAMQLNSSLSEMKAEMPTLNPDFKSTAGVRRFNLKSTKSLAEKERGLFKTRLKQ